MKSTTLHDVIHLPGVRHLTTAQVHAEVNARWGRLEVSNSAAVAIASQWASAGAVGCHLAALSTGAPVTRSDLLDDLAATRRVHRRVIDDQDSRNLDMLGTWILNYEVVPRPCPVCGWQYADDLLEQARRGDVRLDPMPTHRCLL